MPEYKIEHSTTKIQDIQSKPMIDDEIIENIVAATNQSRGSVLAVLSELDVQLESGLKAGRVVHLPNRTHYRPIGKKEGTIDIQVRVNPISDKNVNMSFRGKWRNAANIGKSEAEIIDLWNEAHPEDPIAPVRGLPGYWQVGGPQTLFGCRKTRSQPVLADCPGENACRRCRRSGEGAVRCDHRPAQAHERWAIPSVQCTLY